MLCLENNSNDPFYNLAFEQLLFEEMPLDEPLFWLWRNSPVVVVGRYQNTAEEVNLAYADSEGIDLVRRDTGGGAVYHDLGNINFSILYPECDLKSLELGKLLEPVIKTLRELGVPAQLSGRNDILLNGKKFSGCAFEQKDGRVLVHGTMLFDVDLERMVNVLTVNAEKLASKGVQSVRSRVTNLQEYLPEVKSPEEFMRLFFSEIRKLYGTAEFNISDELKKHAAVLAEEKYRSKSRTFGRSPGFSIKKSRRFSFGTVEARLDIKKGSIIESCVFSGDFFGVKDIKELEDRLKGRDLSREGLQKALAGADAGEYISGITSEDLAEMLLY